MMLHQQDLYRFQLFLRNLRDIDEHNAKESRTYSKGLNQFSALSQEEFEEMYLSQPIDRSRSASTRVQKVEQPPLRLNVDWVTKGAVTSVKNQGACKAAYAFAVVGAIEGYSAIYFRQAVEFSAQQIVDCSAPFGNKGCNGGNVDVAFSFVEYRGNFGTIKVESSVRRPTPIQVSSALARVRRSPSRS
jgi:C1A family cysteine protease